MPNSCASSESILAQRERVARWKGIVACERRGRTGSSPMLSSGDDVEAKHRLCVGRALGHDKAPAELPAF